MNPSPKSCKLKVHHKFLLDGLVRDFGEKYPFTSLRPNASIINDPDFESGTAKLQGGSERAFAHFLRDGVPDSILNSPDQELGYADRVLLAGQQEKRARLEKSKYRSAKHVTSQSNICERLFSHAKLIMSNLRLLCCSENFERSKSSRDLRRCRG